MMRGQPNLDRFGAPNRHDEDVLCVHCGRKFHYTEVCEDGFCVDCRPEEQEENAKSPDSL